MHNQGQDFIQICFQISFSFHAILNPPIPNSPPDRKKSRKKSQIERNLFKIENKITRYSHRRIFLEKNK